MRFIITISITVVVTLFASSRAECVTIRYALIVGNNVGLDADGSQPFVPLMHAEREAKVLREKLVRLSNFDSTESRTRLLMGASRTEVKRAMRALVKKKKEDEKSFGRIETLFLFYFTGHGLEGRLLLDDGALFAHEIGEMFTSMDTDFSVGVFDACFAGSLDNAALVSKGIRSAPKLNLFRELPEEVLSAEGRIWYVSSSRDQESYEDERLGGVFTHFFTEALEQADTQGPGITLENIWQYARAHTVEYTAERRRMQVPEQFIANLRSNAPIYFSFPKKRSATLLLSESLEGRFVLAYREGNLTEIFEKQRGRKRKLAVYPGNARLLLVDRNNKVISRTVSLKPKATVYLSGMQEPRPKAAVGERTTSLFEKGVAVESRLAATRVEPGLTFLFGVSYQLDIANEELLYTRHGFAVPLRFDVGQTFWGGNFKYGLDKRRYSSWGYELHSFGNKLMLGYGFDVRNARVGGAAVFSYSYMKQHFDDGEERSNWQLRPAVEVTLLLPRARRLQAEAFMGIGPMYTSGVGLASERRWRFLATLGLSVYFRVL